MEQTIFYIGQALGILAVIMGFVTYQMKSREGVLISSTLVNVIFALHYLCLGAWSAMLMKFVGIVRNVTYYQLGKKGRVKKRVSLAFAVIIGGMGAAAGLLGGENWYILLSVINVMIFSFSISFKDPNNVRKSLVVSAPFALIYNGLVLSVGGVIFELISLISALIGLVRYGKKKCENIEKTN